MSVLCDCVVVWLCLSSNCHSAELSQLLTCLFQSIYDRLSGSHMHAERGGPFRDRKKGRTFVLFFVNGKTGLARPGGPFLRLAARRKGKPLTMLARWQTHSSPAQPCVGSQSKGATEDIVKRENKCIKPKLVQTKSRQNAWPRISSRLHGIEATESY